MRTCPLLDTARYECDSVNLSDETSKDYWLHCILEMLKIFRAQALQSQSDVNSDVEQRATKFFGSTREQIIKLSEEEYPTFSIRRLLDLIQFNLKLHRFEDPWQEKKQLENKTALTEFSKRLNEVDTIVNTDAKWTNLIKGVLAGEAIELGSRVRQFFLSN